VCDISDLPFEKDSFDSAILSLALMGTNYNKFLEEAYRVLKIMEFYWLLKYHLDLLMKISL